MDGLKQKAKYTLFGVKIIALIFALWIVVFNDPVVEVVAENQFFIADTNFLHSFPSLPLPGAVILITAFFVSFDRRTLTPPECHQYFSQTDATRSTVIL